MAEKNLSSKIENAGEDTLEKGRPGQKSRSLLVKFARVFSIFTIVSVISCGIATYFLQNRIYNEQVQANVRDITDYLHTLIKADDMDFVNYQNYLIEHKDEILIPYDYDGDYLPAEEEFVRLCNEQYPGKTIGVDIDYEDLSDEVKKAHVKYTHEYWLKVFESAAEIFNIDYAYYITPTGEPGHVYYLIDAVREPKNVGDKTYIELCLDIFEDPDKYPVMWSTLEEGKILHYNDIFDNELGHTKAFYSPLIINGKVQGLICVDVKIESVNHEILRNSIFLTIGIAMVLFVGVCVMQLFISRKHISRLDRILNSVKKYTATKDPGIAKALEYDERENDEISALARQTAAMILELDQYMKNLTHTAKELSETRQHADELQALANRDSLTGIRNKTAYDEEVRRLEWEVAGGNDKFGIALVDLNYLKKINDQYGSDKGNIAVKKLCFVVCNVFHHSPVFRIGGDEFAVILKNRDYENVDKLVEEFNNEVEKYGNDESLDPWERISAAIGIALFNPKSDFTVDDVFKRADANMYKRKHDMKADRD